MIRQSVLFLIMRYTFTDLGYFDPGCEAISARWLNRFWLKSWFMLFWCFFRCFWKINE